MEKVNPVIGLPTAVETLLKTLHHDMKFISWNVSGTNHAEVTVTLSFSASSEEKQERNHPDRETKSTPTSSSVTYQKKPPSARRRDRERKKKWIQNRQEQNKGTSADFINTNSKQTPKKKRSGEQSNSVSKDSKSKPFSELQQGKSKKPKSLNNCSESEPNSELCQEESSQNQNHSNRTNFLNPMSSEENILANKFPKRQSYFIRTRNRFEKFYRCTSSDPEKPKTVIPYSVPCCNICGIKVTPANYDFKCADCPNFYVCYKCDKLYGLNNTHALVPHLHSSWIDANKRMSMLSPFSSDLELVKLV